MNRQPINLQKATKAQKPVLLFENKYYAIHKIPYNHRITFKKTLAHQNPNSGMDRDWYNTGNYNRIESTKALAEEIIKEHWKKA